MRLGLPGIAIACGSCLLKTYSYLRYSNGQDMPLAKKVKEQCIGELGTCSIFGNKIYKPSLPSEKGTRIIQLLCTSIMPSIYGCG